MKSNVTPLRRAKLHRRTYPHVIHRLCTTRPHPSLAYLLALLTGLGLAWLTPERASGGLWLVAVVGAVMVAGRLWTIGGGR